MKQQKTKLLRLVLSGLFSIGFLTLITISFYNYVLQRIGVDHAENTRTYAYHLVMLVSDVDSLFWQDVYDSMRREAAERDAFVELKGREKSAEYAMTDYMDMAIAADVDGILLEYTGEEGLSEKVNEAAEKGIHVVTMLNDAPNTARQSYVGINSYQLGQKYGQEIKSLLLEKENPQKITVLLHHNSIDSNQSQIFNQINNLMVTSEETHGRVQVEERRISSGSAFETEKSIWDLFKEGGKAPDVIVCMDEVDTEAAYQAVINYNRVGKTQIIGYYQSKTTLEAVKHGTLAMSLWVDTAQMGIFGAQAMMECILDGRTNSFYSVGLQFITADNVGEFIDGSHKKDGE